LVDVGVTDIVGLVLAPHYSAASVGQYHDRARAACAEAGVGYAGIHSWWSLDAYRRFLAREVVEALADLPAATKVLITAHSLPLRVLEDDPYVAQLTSSAAAIAEEASLAPDRWSLGWQSAGRTPEPWMGPDILDELKRLAADEHTDGVLVVPHGFTSDHLEVAYDLDIEAARLAESLGLAFARTAVVNDDPTTMGELAELIHDQVPETGLPADAIET
ncbi:MAG: ferrochelatase, partial [Microthrixaceae bacterium]|nr:ferrochelatase [Microthrixaceae bacterium]